MLNISTKNVKTIEMMRKKEYYPKEFDTEINKADILFLPMEGRGTYKDILFHENTDDIFQYFDDNDKGIKVEICCSDDNFKILQLHSEELRIAELIVNAMVLPMVINWISNWAYNKFANRKIDVNKDVEIDTKINVVGKEKSIVIDYKGNKEGLESILEHVQVKEILGEHEL